MMYLLLFVMGAICGSFANVCIHRLPKEESIYWPASHCPHCLTPLRWRDNIPLLSFLWLRRRCRTCHTNISWRYFGVELSMALLFCSTLWRWHLNIPMVVLTCFVGFILLTVSIIDYLHRIIPDECSGLLILAGWMTSRWNPILQGESPHPVYTSIAASITGVLLLYLLAWGGEKMFKKEALGGGDVKLIGGIGATLGWNGLWGALFLGSLIGGIVGIVLMGLKRKKREDSIPFGPFLSLGAYLTILLPINWLSFLFP